MSKRQAPKINAAVPVHTPLNRSLAQAIHLLILSRFSLRWTGDLH